MIALLETRLYGDVTLWNLIWVGLIVVIFALLAKAVTLNLKKTLADKMKKSELELLIKLINYGAVVFAVIVALPMLSIDLSGLLLAGGFGALVIGFASQSVVTNLVSGIFLILERPIKIGDQVRIGDVEGFVEDIRIISTIIRAFDGVYIRLPNEKVFTSMITNLVADVARRFDYQIGIAYREDAARAIAVIRKTIEAHPFALVNPAPAVFVDKFGDSSVNIIARVWAPSTEWMEVKREILLQIKTALDLEGIEIPFPQRVIWFGEGRGSGVAVQSATPPEQGKGGGE